jgi:hypothetical protein
MKFKTLSKMLKIFWVIREKADDNRKEIAPQTKFYHYLQENAIIRFDTAEKLLWEQRHKDQLHSDNGDLK